MRVLLADEHSKVRWALRTFIKEESGLTLAGEASEASSLLSQALTLQPDLILLEWELPGWPVDKLLSSLRALDLPARVIVLSSQPESKQAALTAGADGFVLKANGSVQLLAALRQIMAE